MGSGSTQQHGGLVGGDEAPQALGEDARTGRGLVELAVEVMEQLPDGLGVRGVREANGAIGRIANR